MTQKLEEAKRLYKTANADQKYVLERLFPELKDEDERIRENIIATIHLYYGEPLEDEAKEMIAWLKKQREQKPSTIDIDKMVDDYANNKERGNEEFGKPVLCMVRAYRQGLNDAIGKVVLKPAWSENDDRMLRDVISYAEHEISFKNTPQLNWLKSLKERYTWKPSDEQLEALKGVQEGVFRLGILESLYNDLEKLKMK